MRRELVGLKNALYRAQTNAGGLRQHATPPIRHFAVWEPDRKTDDPSHPRGGQVLLAGLARLITKKPINTLVHEAFLPAPHHGLAELRATYDLVGAAALGRCQDHFGTLDVFLFGIAVPDNGLQPKTIIGRDSEADPCSHALSMNCFAYLGNPLNASDH